MQYFKNRGEADKGPLCEDCVWCLQEKRVAATHQWEERLARSSWCGKTVDESQGFAVHFLQTHQTPNPCAMWRLWTELHPASQRLIQLIEQPGISFSLECRFKSNLFWDLLKTAHVALCLHPPGKRSSWNFLVQLNYHVVGAPKCEGAAGKSRKRWKQHQTGKGVSALCDMTDRGTFLISWSGAYKHQECVIMEVFLFISVHHGGGHYTVGNAF